VHEDGTATATATIAHFSDVSLTSSDFVGGQAGTLRIEIALSGIPPVPASLAVGESFDVAVEVFARAEDVERARYVDKTNETGGSLRFDGTSGEQLAVEDPFHYVCQDPGQGLYRAFVELAFRQVELVGLGTKTIGFSGVHWRAEVARLLACIAPPTPTPTGELVQEVPGADGVARAPDGFPGRTTGAAFVVGAEGGSQVRSSVDGSFLGAGPPLPQDWYGALGLRAQIGGNTKEALLQFGPTGAALTPYDAQSGFDGFTEVTAEGSGFTDACTWSDGTGCVATDFGLGWICEYTYRTDNGFEGWSALPDLGPMLSFPVGETPVSACTDGPGASIYVVTIDAAGEGRLYEVASRASPVAQFVADVGPEPRRVRACAGLYPVTSYELDAILVTTFDGGHVHPVGDGPIGIDCKRLPDGRVALLTTGFNDNTWRVTVLLPDGSLHSELGPFNLPAGLTEPTGGAFVGETDEGACRIAIAVRDHVVLTTLEIP